MAKIMVTIQQIYVLLFYTAIQFKTVLHLTIRNVGEMIILLQHTDICEFPSKDYYGGKLKTVAKCGESVLQIGGPGLRKTTRIAFVDIRGKEIIQIVSTNRGNEKSVANIEESIEAVSKAY